jgi:hypothetical protein
MKSLSYGRMVLRWHVPHGRGPILSDHKLALDELIAQLQKCSSAPLYVHICQKYRVDILLFGQTRYRGVPSLLPLYLPPRYGSGTM